ncbi:CHAT domain-containing protein [Streptomyces luteogriseus]|uniref:CHAT domain-containing tetratricopeptide repeat protein n=1 Tax=Streptomyces luteogriseus TaxID=68233 RepID=UPI00379D50F9
MRNILRRTQENGLRRGRENLLSAYEEAAEVLGAEGTPPPRSAEDLLLVGMVWAHPARLRGEVADTEGHRQALAEAEDVLRTLRAQDREEAEAVSALVTQARHAHTADPELPRLIRLGHAAWAARRPDRAADLLREALTRARQAGERHQEARILSDLGTVLRAGGVDPAEGLLVLALAQGLAWEIGDLVTTARSSLGLCDAWAEQGRLAEAGIAGELALRAAGASCDWHGVASAHNHLGHVDRLAGRFDSARHHYDEALQLYRRIGEAVGVSDATYNLSTLSAALGTTSEGVLQGLEDAARQYGDDDDREAAADTEQQRGMVLYRQGRYQEALQVLEGAARHAAGSPRHESMVDNVLGCVYRQLGLLERSRDHLERAWETVTALGDELASGAISNNLALTHMERQDHLAAIRCLRHADDVAQRLAPPEIADRARGNLASALMMASHAQQAVPLAEQALETAVRRGNMADEMLHRNTLGSALVALARLDEAMPHLRAGLDLANRLGAPDAAVALLYNTARARRMAGDTDGAVALYAQALESVSALRRGIVDDAARASFLAARTHLYVEYACLLAGLTRHAEAFDVIEQAKARTLLDLLDSAPRHGGHPVSAPAGPAGSEPWPVDRLRARLTGPGVAVLSYLLGTEHSILLAVTDTGIESHVLPARHEIDRMVHELRSAVTEERSDLGAGHDLYLALVAPAAGLIGSRDLVIAPDGSLHLLPFALLLTEPAPDGCDVRDLAYLIRNHAVCTTPSATTAALTLERAAAWPAGEDGIAVYADPDWRGCDAPPRLHRSAHEAWWLAELFSPDAVPLERPEAWSDERVRLRTGTTASKADVRTLLRDSRRFRFLHFATHGLLDEERPLMSGLLLAGDTDAAEDLAWRGHEILDARITSELVVLSACETGLGRVRQGEGVTGLLTAFLQAGADAVAVSLWKVVDTSTPRLMVAFYQGVLSGLSKPQALRSAQLTALAGEYPHPRHWAPFVLYGGLDPLSPQHLPAGCAHDVPGAQAAPADQVHRRENV